MDDLVAEFLTETNESLDTVDVELVRFEQDPNNAVILDNIFRLVHTVKGTCGFLGLPRLEALAHAAETVMGRFRDGETVTPEAVTLILESMDRLKVILAGLEAEGCEPAGSDEDIIARLEIAAEGPPEDAKPADSAAVMVDEPVDEPVPLDELEVAFRNAPGPEDAMAGNGAAPNAADGADGPADGAPRMGATEGGMAQQSIRVNVDTLETLITTVSELVLTRNQLLEISRNQKESDYKVPLQRLSNVTAELQEGVMKTRMQPIGNAWQKLPRIVRDLSRELGKEIELDMVGADTELDRQVLELIRDPLTHMVRNSADHGLEGPEGRREAGKPATGRIRVSAHHEGGHIIITVADDGRGLNADRIRRKALENGLASEAELDKLSEAQLHRYIFAPSFSTAETVTSVSGRGVGMDVVRSNIELIGGSIDVKSTKGEGTSFTIKIPLTLAIVSALLVECGEQRFAIPQIAVIELVRAQSGSETRIEYIKDAPVLRLRDRLLPLVRLADILGLDEGAAGAGSGEATDRILESAGFIVVLQVGSQNFGLVVDSVLHTEEIVVKPMSTLLRGLQAFSGNTILGDGSVIMILDPGGIAEAVASETGGETAGASVEDKPSVGSADNTMSLLLFRAGGRAPKAVPLELVTRLEELEVERIEHVDGRDVVQYREQLMPLVYVNSEVRLREEGQQPIIVFTDGDRAMGLVIDEIVDIVEASLDISLGSERPGVLGTAIIREVATEAVDVAHYLEQAFTDWFGVKDKEPAGRSVLLVDDSAFFRNMLAPVLRSAGYQVAPCSSAAEALTTLEAGHRFDVIVTDIEMPEMDGYAFAEKLSGHARFAGLPIVALSSHATEAAVERGRRAGFRGHVAKFDRTRLVATLEEMTRALEEAA